MNLFEDSEPSAQFVQEFNLEHEDSVDDVNSVIGQEALHPNEDDLFEDSDSDNSAANITVYSESEIDRSIVEVLLSATERTRLDNNESEDIFTRDTFICDTGASCHLTNSLEGMFDKKTSPCKIKIGSGEQMDSTIVGTKKVVALYKDGGKQELSLTNCRYVPELWINLFSVNKALTNGYKLSNDGMLITLTKDDKIIRFDRCFGTGSGKVIGVFTKPKGQEMAQISLDRKTTTCNTAHKCMAHAGETTTRWTAAYYGLKLQGELDPCTHCGMAKARQKNLVKMTDIKSQIRGERLFIDSSWSTKPTFGGTRYWLLIMDDKTGFLWTYFLHKKSDTSEVMINLITHLDKQGVKVKYIRCDNAGEHLSFQEACNRKGLGITFEFTSRATPQHNGRVERKFQTLYNKIKAMLNYAGITPSMRKGLWAEAANTAVMWDNASVHKVNDKPPFTKFYNKNADYVDNLHAFGELGTVLDPKKKDIKAKITNKGELCMMLGPAANHAKDTCRMWNLKTNKVIISRDIYWLNQTYGAYYKKLTDEFKRTMTELEEDDHESIFDVEEHSLEDSFEFEEIGSDTSIKELEDDSGYENIDNRSKVEMLEEASDFPTENMDVDITPMDEDNMPQDDTQEQVASDTEVETPSDQSTIRSSRRTTDRPTIMDLRSTKSVLRSGKAFSGQSGREMGVLNVDFLTQSITTDLFNNQMIDQKYTEETANLVTTEPQHPEYIEPKTFQQAYNHEDPLQRTKWREAIGKEMKDMKARNVWTKIKRSQVPKDRRCVKNKWVFKIKRNGTFRARLVACGYSQIPGVDHEENYAPVVNDVTYRILIICIILMKLQAKIVDVETAFLHGDIDVEIYMNCPEGLEHTPDECVILNHTIYGLVQSARQFFKKLVKCLTDLGFVKGDVDPCLLTKKTNEGIIYVAIYVDDCLFVGSEKLIQETIKGIKKWGLEVTVDEDLTDYLSCRILFNEDKTKAWLGQPHLIKNIKAKLGDLVSNLQTYRTPGTPSQGILRLKDDELEYKLDEENHALYRTGVGMLLYLVKHSRPDIANPVRELSKVLDRPNEAALKEMKRITKFVLDTANHGLKIEPQKMIDDKWVLKVYTDSDWAGDKNTRISVSGYVLYLMNVPILWRSKSQKAIALSSSEAEYYALGEAAKDVKFVHMLLTSMSLKVNLPIVVKVDNVGAIFMTENISTSGRTKHLDLRARYVNKMVDDKFIRFEFVRSGNNLADFLTKNVTGDIYEKHISSYIAEKSKVIPKEVEVTSN